MEHLSNSELQRDREEIRQIILERAYDDKKEVILASGETSSQYFDLRLLTLDGQWGPRLAQHACRILNLANVSFTTVGGMELGAVPLAKDIANESQIPTFVIRKETKNHGTGNRIENAPSAEDEILLVDDVTTTGNSLIEAIEVLRSQGLEPSAAMAYIDRSQRRVQELMQEQKLPYVSIFTAEEIVNG